VRFVLSAIYLQFAALRKRFNTIFISSPPLITIFQLEISHYGLVFPSPGVEDFKMDQVVWTLCRSLSISMGFVKFELGW
jgi:hypothetical protein